jgi:hypothetical protein
MERRQPFLYSGRWPLGARGKAAKRPALPPRLWPVLYPTGDVSQLGGGGGARKGSSFMMSRGEGHVEPEARLAEPFG